MLSLTIGYIIWWSPTIIFIHYFATTFHQATVVLNESGDKGMTALLTEQLIHVQLKIYVFTIDPPVPTNQLLPIIYDHISSDKVFLGTQL